MRYAVINDYLEKLQGENSKLSLDNIGLIIANLPFAIGTVKYIQVAGTNGKGSTSHFIAAILRSAGGSAFSHRRICRMCVKGSALMIG
jgi:folylpolyglutamate synthase/dihydropteroate synthase